jgi:hypothetical protein
MCASVVELTLGLDLNSIAHLFRDPHTNGLVLNVGAFDEADPASLRLAIDDVVKEARQIAGDRDLGVDMNPERFMGHFSKAIDSPRLDVTSLDRIRYVLAHFTVRANDFKIRRNQPPPYPSFNLGLQRNVARYGNVELAVLESYLRDPSRLFISMTNVVKLIDNESAMYAPGFRAHHLDSSDYDWNLRRMMTNAGFYTQRDVNSAWTSLVDWAECYLSAMRNNYLAAYSGALPFALGTMRIIWERYGERARHVQHPNAFEVYPVLEGQNIMFMSPMAELVSDQVDSGRIGRLFTHYQVPPFVVRTLPAWVSIWPNRPHADWSDTFARMRESLDAAYRQQPFDIFMASCGCYGLPICEYARSTFGCKTLYLGNIVHAFFGIRQSSSSTFAQGKVNEDAWIAGNLGKFTNMSRIDGGRYV